MKIECLKRLQGKKQEIMKGLILEFSQEAALARLQYYLRLGDGFKGLPCLQISSQRFWTPKSTRARTDTSSIQQGEQVIIYICI